MMNEQANRAGNEVFGPPWKDARDYDGWECETCGEWGISDSPDDDVSLSASHHVSSTGHSKLVLVTALWSRKSVSFVKGPT
jgi:hypothetical protein